MTLDWTHETMGGQWYGETFQYLVATTPSGRKYRWSYFTGLQFENKPGDWRYANTAGFTDDNLTLMVQVAEELLAQQVTA